MAKEIFISYRRDDSAGTTGRIYDRLVGSFPKHTVFMDVDAAMHGLDFSRVLDEKIASSSVVVVVIGPNWLTAKDAQGRRRIENIDDFVRIEVGAALKREIPVIPVLVDAATMPSEADLPPDLGPLSRRHAVELRNARFADDADTLVTILSQRLGGGRKGNWWAAAVTALSLAAIGMLVAQIQFRVPPTGFVSAEVLSTQDNRSSTAQSAVTDRERMRVAEENAERERYRERIRQLEIEATERTRRENESEASRNPNSNVAALPLCERLWRQRNEVFHKFGFCFSTPKGRNVFGNSGCSRNMDETWRAMSEENRRFVKRVQEQERANGC